MLAYRRVILKEDIKTFTPLPTEYRYLPLESKLVIQYNSKEGSIDVRGTNGFEVSLN